MSVSMLIWRDGEERTVLIATAQIFRDHWQPLAERLGLHWISGFNIGMPIEPRHVEDVLDELRRLEEYLKKSLRPAPDDQLETGRPATPETPETGEGAIPETIEGAILARVQNAARELRAVRGDPRVEVWVG